MPGWSPWAVCRADARDRHLDLRDRRRRARPPAPSPCVGVAVDARAHTEKLAPLVRDTLARGRRHAGRPHRHRRRHRARAVHRAAGRHGHRAHDGSRPRHPGARRVQPRRPRRAGAGRGADGVDEVLVATDARRKEVYWARYGRGADGAVALDRAGRRPPGRAAPRPCGRCRPPGAGRCSTPTCSRTPSAAARRRPRLAGAGGAAPARRRASRCRSSRSTCAAPTRLDHRRAGCVVSVVAPTLREARWTDLPALAALERDLFAHDAWSEPTWWAELAGRPRRDYVVLDRRRRRARVRRARPRRRGRRRHDARRRSARAGPRARAAAPRRAGAAGAPRAARRTSSSRCAPTTPPRAASTSAAGTPCSALAAATTSPVTSTPSSCASRCTRGVPTMS